MMMILGIFILFIFIFQFTRHTPPPQNTPEGSGSIATAASSSTPATATSGAQVSPTAGITKQATQEAPIVVENSVYKITFSNRGAEVTSWILKNYKDNKQRPLDLVHQRAAEKYGYPLSLYTYDESLRNKLNQALYVVSPANAATIEAPGSVTFEYADNDVVVRKTFSFDTTTYLIKADVSVLDVGLQVAAFLSWPGGFGDQTVAATYLNAKIEYAPDEKVERVPVKKVSGGNTVRGPFYWAGTGDQYFAAVFLPNDLQSAAMVELSNTITIPKNLEKPEPNQNDTVPVLGAASGSLSGTFKTRIFAGPKNLEVLNSIRTSDATGESSGPLLGSLVDFGFFSPISKPIFFWLRWTSEHWTHNWGWAILILTVIINASMLPLRLPAMRSQLKMQKIQPQMTEIKERYKKYKIGDPKKAEEQAEMMALYKRENINMFAGCIPMILQLPFLYAFYAVLGNTIELRQAHWFWIGDLSSPDPYHILPILFVSTMILTQRLMPSPGVDPAQQKMMAIMMPVMLGVFTWNYAAGLSLYWAASNLIQIG